MVEKLKTLDRKLDLLFIGSGGSIEKRILAGQDINFVKIPAGKLRRYRRGITRELLDIKTVWANSKAFFSFLAGYKKAVKILRKFRPDVIFIKGGDVSLPVGLAARKLKIPYVLHDSDSRLSLTTRYLADSATKVAVGWPLDAYQDYNYKNMIFTGNPLRLAALRGDRASALAFFHLTEQKPIILIFGGSLGAQRINQVVFEKLSVLVKKYQLIHITGENDIEKARFLADHLDQPAKSSYKVYSLLKTEIGLAYAASDLIVTRGGASSLSEIASWAKPAIIIPLAIAANNEQYHNAQILARAGAARLLTEDQLDGFRLVSEIDKLIASPAERQYLSKIIVRFEHKDAALRLAQLIIKSAQKKRQT